MLLLAMTIASPTVAQTRRKTTTRRTTTMTKKTTVKKTTTAAKTTSGKFTIYVFPCNVNCFYAPDYVYTVDLNYGNAVRRIDKNTGEVSVIIPARQQLYEGEERPKITSVGVVKKGVFIYTPAKVYFAKLADCANVSTWEEYGKGYGNEGGANFPFAVSADCNTFAFGTLGGKFGNSTYVVSLGTKPMKELKHAKYDTFANDPFSYNIHLSNNGILYKLNGLTTSYVYIDTNAADPKLIPFKEEWTKTFRKDQNNPSIYNDGLSVVFHSDDNIYASYHRRVYCRSASQPTAQWTTYAKIAPTEPGTFSGFAINEAGDILAKNGANGGYMFIRKGEDIPTRLKSPIVTDIKDPGSWKPFVEWWTTYCYKGDNKGNFLFEGEDRIMIYNPDGINGYTQTKGKFIKVQ